jgi:hypothetical protein
VQETRAGNFGHQLLSDRIQPCALITGIATPIGDIAPFSWRDNSWKYVTNLDGGDSVLHLAAYYALATLPSPIDSNQHTSFSPPFEV